MGTSSLFLLFILFALTLSAPLPSETTSSETTPSETTSSANQTEELDESNYVFEYEQKDGYVFYRAAPNSGGSIEFVMGTLGDEDADLEEYMKSLPEYIGKFGSTETKIYSPDQEEFIGYYNLEGNVSGRVVLYQNVTHLGDPSGPFVVTGGYRYEID